ncbi:trimeric dUTP diphosphatase [Synechococcus phage S-CRES1]|nr:trimeric dUTP diphosphatase [Synechococcus phage S-CRES1]
MGLVEPFSPELINPASIDVTLGDEILVENDHGKFTSFDISNDTFYMPPGAFVLAHTSEYVRVPNNLECIFQLKSSRGREGYEHALAGYIDPGFHGRVTLELSNLRRFAELPLRAGMRIGQLRFAKLDEIPMRSYALTGRYHRAEGVQVSRG